jgi:hypothetical protein
MSPAKRPRKALADTAAELDEDIDCKQERSEPLSPQPEVLAAGVEKEGEKGKEGKEAIVQQCDRVNPKKSGGNLMSRLMATPEKEATVRITVDLPKSMHQKLSMLSARTGKKKAEIVRMLLDDVLDDDLLDEV